MLRNCIKLMPKGNKFERVEALENDSVYIKLKNEVLKQFNHYINKKK